MEPALLFSAGRRSGQMQPVCLFEFAAQFRRLQVFANVRQPLLQLDKAFGNFF